MSSIQYPHTLTTPELLRISRNIGLDRLPSNWVQELHARLEKLTPVETFVPRNPLPTQPAGHPELPLVEKN